MFQAKFLTVVAGAALAWASLFGNSAQAAETFPVNIKNEHSQGVWIVIKDGDGEHYRGCLGPGMQLRYDFPAGCSVEYLPADNAGPFLPVDSARATGEAGKAMNYTFTTNEQGELTMRNNDK